jgi:hypothetical protein
MSHPTNKLGRNSLTQLRGRYRNVIRGLYVPSAGKKNANKFSLKRIFESVIFHTATSSSKTLRNPA